MDYNDNNTLISKIKIEQVRHSSGGCTCNYNSFSKVSEMSINDVENPIADAPVVAKVRQNEI